MRIFTPLTSVFSPNAVKYGPGITPYVDPFHVVTYFHVLFFQWVEFSKGILKEKSYENFQKVSRKTPIIKSLF